MHTYQISKNQLNQLLEPYLQVGAHLIAPSLNSLGQVSYNKIQNINEIALNTCIPLKPPKSYLFPESSTLVQFDEKNPHLLESDASHSIQKQMIFGLRPCDLSAIAYLDAFFTSNISDHDYAQRRENTLIVGIACEYPSNACFCTSMGIEPGNCANADIFVVPQGQEYLIEGLTVKGQEYLATLSKDWKEISPELITGRKNEITEQSSSKLIEHIDLSKIRGRLNEIYASDFWNKYSEACIACGACTFDCPTCSCFDVNDTLKSSTVGCRYRSWDSCSFGDFTLHASGHNPRSSKLHRLRQRIMHKYHYTVEKMDLWSCTGCGRCIRVCPVGINTRSILKDAKEALGEPNN
jgi:ferredoxin